MCLLISGTRSVLSKALFKKGAFKQPLDNFNLFMYISAASFAFTMPLWIATEAPLIARVGYKPRDHELYLMILLNGALEFCSEAKRFVSFPLRRTWRI